MKRVLERVLERVLKEECSGFALIDSLIE